MPLSLNIEFANSTETSNPFSRRLLALRKILPLAVAIATSLSAMGQTTTTTSLAVTSSGNPISSVAAGTVITLTASVTAASAAVKQGQVDFCDATAAFCTDIHLLGTTQLNSSGVAQLHLRPSVGSYSYKAIFIGTPKTPVHYAASASPASALTVTGQVPTASTIAQSGLSGDYTLTASVLGFTKSQNIAAPTGTVSFLDTTTNNSLLGMGVLSPVTGPTWLNASNPAVGNLPSSIVTADFNGDGNLDMAVGINSVINSGTLSVSILLGDGQGNFAPVVGNSITAGGVPLAVQDFNQDGIPDLLLSDDFTGSITLLLGNGDGTFNQAPGSPLVSGYGVSPVAVGDFNGDGIPDLVAAGGYYLIVWLGNGDGTFTKLPIASSIFPADSFFSIVVGDFNGDGFADLAELYIGGQTIALFLGNGDGTFTKGATLTVSTIFAGASATLAMGDFNGDGKLDLAAPVTGSNGAVVVFLGNGDGTFQPATGSPVSIVGQGLNRISVADFNGDGIDDFLIGAATSGTDIFVLLGNGDGTFALTSTGSIRLPCCSNIVVGDFNGDGVSDLASTDFYSGTADVFLTGAKQSTASITGVSITGQTPQQAVASYLGEGDYAASQSGPTALLVQAAAPAIIPSSGGVIALGQTITLTSTTPGAGIFYQISGAEQTNGYVQYFAPILVYSTGSLAIQAYTNAYNYGQSASITATYTVVATYPVPVLNSVLPAFAAAGGQELTVTVNGSGFASASVVYLGVTALSTQFVSTSQLTAQIPSTQIVAAGVRPITVQTPVPGGGTSNVLQFEVDSASGTPPSFTTTAATVTAGSTATYPVKLPSPATGVSVTCLNLPAGATCAYSASSGSLTITTSNSTPLGTYQITAVFTETLSGGAALAFVLFLPLPLACAARRRSSQHVLLCTVILGFSVLLGSGCGGSGGSTPPQTHQVTSSGVVTLTVQ